MSQDAPATSGNNRTLRLVTFVDDESRCLQEAAALCSSHGMHPERFTASFGRDRLREARARTVSGTFETPRDELVDDRLATPSCCSPSVDPWLNVSHDPRGL